VVVAQTTAFTYQGRLTDAGNPANGNYDLQFKLFDALGGGAQQGATLARNPVTASAGVFTVTLDFGANVFSGAARYLEIGVRPAGSGSAYTVLTPRQPLTPTPYAIQSLNAATASGLSSACVGCVTGAQIGSLPTNSGSYIQNSATPQAASNFNISGNGFIGGALGIGTTMPFAGYKLDVNGQALLRPGGSGGGFIGLHTPNSETGLTISGNGTTRADLRFDGSTLKLLASAAGIPPPTNGIVISTGGNVGIGTPTPEQQLHVTSSDIAVYGSGQRIAGVYGLSDTGFGVIGSSFSSFAGYFQGKVHVGGVLDKAGGGFKIDHPLDPENKYLVHSFVESPDMKNLYDGAVTTDASGEAEITLPNWFAALNRDFHYQLTCIGVFAQAIIAEKIKDNRFKIKTSLPNVEVSWQVTGIRQDAWANQNRLPVEELKSAVERGSYQNPTAFGQPEERSIEWARHPEMMKRQKEERERWQREQNNKADAPAVRPDN
jgi:hypothetical protein